MVIKLLSTQVPQFWEAIKFACKKADEVDDRTLPAYLNELLHALLSDKAQCWIRMDDNRTLIAVCVTRIQVGKQDGEKSLFIQCLYSWQAQPSDTWNRDMDFVLQFARAEGCKSITFMSRNDGIWELAKKHGFQEATRLFSYRIG